MRRQLLLSVGLLCVTLLAWLLGWKFNAGVGLAVAVVLSSPLVAVALAPLIVPLLGASMRWIATLRAATPTRRFASGIGSNAKFLPRVGVTV